MAWRPPKGGGGERTDRSERAHGGRANPRRLCPQAHVCVLQTALELRSRGYSVHVVADGTSSRFSTDRITAFDRMRQSGVFVTTSESILFQLMVDSEHKAFKTISALAKASLPENGLLRVRHEPDPDSKL